MSDDVEKMEKPDAEWRELLSPESHAVLRKEATSRPARARSTTRRREGTFICAACNLPLFESSAKYESGTGWPSSAMPFPAGWVRRPTSS